DIVSEVIETVLPKYSDELLAMSLGEHKRDIAAIERAYATDSQEKKSRLREQLLETPFIRVESQHDGDIIYKRPGDLYFTSDDLRLYFSENSDVGFVHPEYSQSVQQLFEDLEVADSVRINRRKENSIRHRFVIIEAVHGSHKKGLNRFDPDINVDGLEHAVSSSTMEKSKFIWNNIAVPHSDCIRGVVESCSRQTYENSREMEIVSSFGQLLREKPWLPDLDGNVKKPCDLSLNDLPDFFERDAKLASQLDMKPDVIACLAEKSGISTEDIEFVKNNRDQFEQLKAIVAAHKEQPMFPSKPVANLERRQEGTAEQFDAAPEKDYKKRERSVRTTSGTIDPITWLRNQYTNESRQMVCQICQKEMPFKKRNGEYYFEKKEVLSKKYLPKEHAAQYLALCPLCAAMYKEFVENDENAMADLKMELSDADDCDVPLKFGERETNIRFVEAHFRDLKVILENL
ncbi:MAG: hypothetical protein U9R69_04105, partial [Thermodesulfobacteriota bacterium]|nr:hypothetical protein [Thermodesulfobacteriota bacterium]